MEARDFASGEEVILTEGIIQYTSKYFPSMKKKVASLIGKTAILEKNSRYFPMIVDLRFLDGFNLSILDCDHINKKPLPKGRDSRGSSCCFDTDPHGQRFVFSIVSTVSYRRFRMYESRAMIKHPNAIIREIASYVVIFGTSCV